MPGSNKTQWNGIATLMISLATFAGPLVGRREAKRKPFASEAAAMEESSGGAHHLISSTAKLVAYWRQFSDVPYAREVVEYTRAEESVVQFLGAQAAREPPPIWVTAYIEARYKCMLREVDRRGLKQVLELGSGLALRGLASTRQRPDITYVETDLPGMHQEKERLVAWILTKEAAALPTNLRFAVANALVLSELEAAASQFDVKRPIAILNEGLCQYLTMDEKRQLALNVYQLLRRFGGVWITPDLESNEAKRHRHWDRDKDQQLAEAIAKQTGRHLHENSFETTAEMEAFFESLGFTLASVPMLDAEMRLATLRDEPEASKRLYREGVFIRLWCLHVPDC